MVDWRRQTLGLPTSVADDSDMAGLGEARFGAGRKASVVFYSNVGSNIGGALLIGHRVYADSAGIASEVGHLCPGRQEGPAAKHRFAVIGQSFNQYWGSLIAPLLCFGVARFPASLRDLWQVASFGKMPYVPRPRDGT